VKLLLEKQAAILRERAEARLREAVDHSLADDPDGVGTPAVLTAAIHDFFEGELAETVMRFDEALSAALDPHDERVGALIDEVRLVAAKLFDLPYRDRDREAVLKPTREPYWVTRKEVPGIAPGLASLADRFLPLNMQRARLRRRFEAQVNALVTQNVENLRWATLQNIDAAVRRFGSDLERQLSETVTATRAAISVTLSMRRKEVSAVTDETTRLAELATRLGEIRQILECRSVVRP